jgi:methyl-accepting chemotaxis protein
MRLFDRLRGPWLPARANRIAFRIPALMAMVAAMLVALAATSYLGTRSSVDFLDDLATRDLATRDAISRLSADTEQLNTRLLGVMAKVQSSSGSAERVRGFVAAIQSGWITLADLTPPARRTAEWQAAETAVASLGAFGPQVVATLRASRPLDDDFDTWLETAAALRRMSNQAIQHLDTRIRDRLATDIAQAELATAMLAGLTGGAMLILAGVAWSLIAGVSRPIGRITAVMGRLAEGDTTAQPEGRDRRDEIGSMARAVDVFRASMLRVRAMTEAEQAAAAQRERQAKAMQGYTEDFSGAVTGVMGSFVRSAADMRLAADAVQDAAHQTVARMSQVSATTATSAQSFAAVAASAEEMVASIGAIRQQVGHAAEVSSDAVRTSELTTRLVDSLGGAARQIDDVVQLIDQIAGQTNLLALNATIEAARAGEAGKGFAVVASEVKNLAGQTARATTEISERIRAIQETTGAAIESVASVGRVVGSVDRIAGAIAQAIDEQAIAVQEIVRNVQLASAGTAESAAAVQEVSGRSEQVADQAALVQTAAGDVARRADDLRHEVDSFLAAMSSTRERRSFERHACRIPASALPGDGAALEVELIELSRTGARLSPPVPVAVGDSLVLQVGDDPPLPVRVARQEATLTALTFVPCEAIDRRFAVLAPAQAA